jgi:hypothetical protein
MGADKLIEVMFDTVGTKKLMGTFAKLKKLSYIKKNATRRVAFFLWNTAFSRGITPGRNARNRG